MGLPGGASRQAAVQPAQCLGCASGVADGKFLAAVKPVGGAVRGDGVRQAARSSAGVRASVGSRMAYAYAAASRMNEFERAYADASEALAGRDSDDDPPWLYYLTPSHLDCQAGYALVLAGRAQLERGDRAGRATLRRGSALLRTGAHRVSYGDPSQRRALYEGAWLSLAYAAYSDLERACAEARTALGRLNSVRSPRSNELLCRLSADFRRRARNAYVADMLPDLDRALAAQSSGSRFPQAGGFVARRK